VDLTILKNMVRAIAQTRKQARLRPNKEIRFWHGVSERAIFTGSILLGKPEVIAVWLAFKAVTRWKTETDEIH